MSAWSLARIAQAMAARPNDDARLRLFFEFMRGAYEARGAAGDAALMLVVDEGLCCKNREA